MSRRNEQAIAQFLADHGVGDVLDGEVGSIVAVDREAGRMSLVPA